MRFEWAMPLVALMLGSVSSDAPIAPTNVTRYGFVITRCIDTGSWLYSNVFSLTYDLSEYEQVFKDATAQANDAALEQGLCSKFPTSYTDEWAATRVYNTRAEASQKRQDDIAETRASHWRATTFTFSYSP
jgi:hypothetical protein